MNVDDISRRVIDAADAVGKKTTELIGEGKLLFRIREIERNRDKCFCKIGKYLYTNNRDLLDGEVGEIADCIDALEVELQDLRRNYANARNMKFCGKCGAYNNENSIFCDQCGEKLD